jgi:hypothetical protein
MIFLSPFSRVFSFYSAFSFPNLGPGRFRRPLLRWRPLCYFASGLFALMTFPGRRWPFVLESNLYFCYRCPGLPSWPRVRVLGSAYPVPDGRSGGCRTLLWFWPSLPASSGIGGSRRCALRYTWRISSSRFSRPFVGSSGSCNFLHTIHRLLLPCTGSYMAVFLTIIALL